MSISDKMVTVLLPHYNHRQYLIDAVYSIINQSISNWQLFILNDDEQSLKEYEKLDNRISVYDRVNNERLSSEERINLIVHFCTDIIAYQEADCISMPDRLKHSIDYMHRTECNIITTDGILHKQSGWKPDRKLITRHREMIAYPFSSLMVTRDVFETIPLNKPGYGSDLVWWRELFNHYAYSRHYHISLPLFRKYDYTSNHNKFRTIPILRKLIRKTYLKPQVEPYLTTIEQLEYGNVNEI